MSAKRKIYLAAGARVYRICIAFAFLCCFSGGVAVAQTPDAAQNAGQVKAKDAAEKKTSVLMPVTVNLLEIKIGAAAQDVRDKLGKAEIDDDDGFYYQLSDNQIAQIRLDAGKKVTLISVTYSAESQKAPKFSDVFGAGVDEAAATKPDGSVYRLIRYPESGFWVAYSRTAGEKPEVTVTMQKL